MPKNRKIFLRTEKRRETKKHTKVTKCNADFDEISEQKVYNERAKFMAEVYVR